MRRSLARGSVVLGAGVLAAVLGGVFAALPAAAHVTAHPGTALRGGYAEISFQVPDESATAGTVKLQVTLPTDHPITSVRTRPMPGWKTEVTQVPLNPPVQRADEKITEAVRTVTWTADPGTRIGPGEFDDFDISVGPLPSDADQIVMPAVQTYDDGTVVSWDAPPPAPGAPEPEHPAPVVRLVAAGASTDGTAGSSTDDLARWLGGAGVALGVLAVGLALGAVVRTRHGGRA